MPRWNFGRNIALDESRVICPRRESEVIQILERHRKERIRAIGRLHSWSRVIESDDLLLDLSNLNEIQVRCGHHGDVVQVGAGCQIKRVLSELQRYGKTLPSVGFIAEQSIAGAIATATHGSGRHSLSQYVTGLRIARYAKDTGEPVIDTVTGGAELRALRCALGCTGIILSVTMQCRDEYLVEESFCEVKDLRRVLEFEAKFPLQQFFFVPWRWTFVCQRRRESKAKTTRIASLYHLYRWIVFDLLMHILILIFVRLLPSWNAVKFLFRWVLPWCVIRKCPVVAPSSSQLIMKHELFRHLELELFVRRARLSEAIEFVRQSLVQAAGEGSRETVPEAISGATSLIDDWQGIWSSYCHHYPICVRRVCPDDTLISMSANEVGQAHTGNTRTDTTEDWYAITFTCYESTQRREAFLRLAEFLAKSMAVSFGARPHWGKLCPLTPEQLVDLYPGLPEFARICREHDPDTRFGSEWTDAVLSEALRSSDPVTGLGAN